ncbi:unnamed protein product [Onchocerca flexuosa]|uniref:Ovule protein n=1 Tax=Onchocerca flexuosa TaxID=387005 RepID=A0A183HZY7_9BILA|nr:unnamed protein product [Onchocerca flexuosa]
MRNRTDTLLNKRPPPLHFTSHHIYVCMCTYPRIHIPTGKVNDGWMEWVGCWCWLAICSSPASTIHSSNLPSRIIEPFLPSLPVLCQHNTTHTTTNHSPVGHSDTDH